MNYQVFTDHDLEEFAKEEQRKKLRAKAQADASEKLIGDLLAELAERALRRKSIDRNDLVIVSFKKGKEECRFEGVNQFHWSGRPRVWLRAFTKRGKPFKQASDYEPSIIPFMTRKEHSNG